MIPNSPLQWPAGWKRTISPKRSRFGSWNKLPTIAASTNLVKDELRKLGAKDLVVSTNLKYKSDGFPYSNQKEPSDQGAAVYFTYNGQHTVIACDTYDKIGCNLHAIGKTIEAMRAIERHGASELLQRAFTGFKALSSGSTEHVVEKNWWDILQCPQWAPPEKIKEQYRFLAKKHHPDTPGVDVNLATAMFKKIGEAYEKAKALYPTFKF